MKTNDETYNYINFPNKNKEFEFDEDTYHITFTFNGSNQKTYQLTIHENYQLDDYVQLDEKAKELKNDKVVAKFDHDDDNYGEMEDDLRPILIEICNFTKILMKKYMGELQDR